jgi:general secretion pathway protein F
MAKFRYTAIDAMGKPVNRVADAMNEAALADHVQGEGLLLLRAAKLGQNNRFFDFLHADLAWQRGLSTAALAHITRELAVMLAAGQDIDHALQFLIEISEDKRSRHVVETIRNRVRGGTTLAVALAEQPAVFTRLYISLVRAGEAGGNLAEALTQLADLLDRQQRLKADLQAALTYPVLLIFGAIATVVFLLSYVLPQFTPVFEQAGAQLPRPTRVLIGLGAFVRHDGLLLLVALLLLGLIAYRLLNVPGPRLAFERCLLRIPVAGTLIRRVEAGRLTRTLGTLLSNGVGLVGALAIVRDVLGNRVAVTIIDSASAQVKAGTRLAAALKAGQFFPAQTIHLIQLGEETGRLGEMTLRAAAIHDEQVGQSVQRLVALLVPVITVVMGAIVAGIVSSLLLAMLSLNDLAL